MDTSYALSIDFQQLYYLHGETFSPLKTLNFKKR